MTIIDQPRPSRARHIFNNRLVRLLTLFFVTVFAYAGAQTLAHVVVHMPAANRDTYAIAAEIVSVVLLLLIYRRFVGWTEHRSAGEVAARKVSSIIPGAVIGLGLFIATIAILSAMGVAHIGGYTPGQALLAATNMAILAAVGEEIIFRGVVFRIVEEMFGTLAALVVSALLFGLIHLGNPGATLVSGAAIAIEAGVLLAASYMWVRNLWLPIGLHFGWNFAEGGIFGTAVSGNSFKGLWSTTFTGPDLLTGGKFGPEASIVAVAVCATAALVILIVAIRRGEWRPRRLSINDRG